MNDAWHFPNEPEPSPRPNGHAGDYGAETHWRAPDPGVLAPHRALPPALPAEVFGPYWASWISRAAAAKGAPPDYVAAGLLAVAGSLLAMSWKVRPWHGWHEPAVLWTAVIGNPSAGKSPALDAIMEPARELEAELNEDFADRQREWKTEKRAAELRQQEWEKSVKVAVESGHPPPIMPENCEVPEPPHRRRLLTNDTTPERLVRLVAVNPFGVVVHRDELAGWLGGMDRYGGSGAERALYLEAFGARPFTLDRVKEANPIHCPALAVGICGGIQPDRLATLLLGGDDDGLAARLIYVWPAPAPIMDVRHLPPVNSPLRDLRALADLPRQEAGAIVLPLTDQAAAEMVTWKAEVRAMEAEASGMFLSWLGKLPGLAARLALVLEHLWWLGERHAVSAPVEVSHGAMEAATAFLDGYAKPMAARAFGDAALPETERDAAALARWLRSQPLLPETLNTRALRRSRALSTGKAERYDLALAELEEAGWVRAAPSRIGGGTGRQRKDWQVNPAVAELVQ